MKRTSVLVVAILLGEATRVLAQTCELRIEGSIDLPRSCVSAPVPDSDVRRRTGSNPYATRTTSPSPYVVKVGIDMSPVLFDWIRESWAGGQPTKSGTLRLISPGGEAAEIVDFGDAHIAEVTFPALSVGNKEGAYFGVKIQPTSANRRRDDAPEPIAKRAGDTTKAWRSSNFRLLLAGLPTRQVFRIASFAWHQTGAFPNLAVTIGARDRKAWVDWARESSSRSKRPAGGGYVAFLAPDLKTEVGRLTLDDVLPISVSPPDTAAKRDRNPSFMVELGVGRMGLERP